MVNKKNLIIIVLSLIVLSGGIYYYTTREKTNEPSSDGTVIEEPNNETDKVDEVDETDEVDQGSVDETEEQGETSENATDIAVGKVAPNFTLKDLDGKEVSLEDYRGKIVLLNFWATWCKWCDVEMPDLQKLDKENEDLVVLAIDVMEDKETVKKYIQKGGYDFKVLLDEDGEISKTYLVSGFPTSYFIDKDGILLGGVPGMMKYEQMVEILESIKGDID